ncbi:MAG: hypothetical protein NTY76_03530 [Candidatus Omnitrophica bacterium]|nr:hypothetical protein [Candidatus Omnitrophota bacterium]
MNDIVRSVRKTAYLTGAAAGAMLLFRNEIDWAAGLMAGILWCVINYSLTVSLFEMALLQKEPKRITRALIIKFPVLYIGGFFILKYKLFPVMSLLTGIGLTLLIIGIMNIWPKRA